MSLLSPTLTYSLNSPQASQDHRKRHWPTTMEVLPRKRVSPEISSDASSPEEYIAEDHSEDIAHQRVQKEIDVNSIIPASDVPRRKGPFLDDDDDDDDDDEDESTGSPRPMIVDGKDKGSNLTPELLQETTAEPSNDHLEESMPHQRVVSSRGKVYHVHSRVAAEKIPFERLIANRSHTEKDRATKSYYGIDIHRLLDMAKAQQIHLEAAISKSQALQEDSLAKSSEHDTSIDDGSKNCNRRRQASMLWTERYRARKFTDLVGDDRVHRDVLRWLKSWDPIVFPENNRLRAKSTTKSSHDPERDERAHAKILLLNGPPGLGKTTLAHVCARQAGYEVLEINASDERTSSVVKERIRTCAGTENVRGVNANTEHGTVRRAGRPVCVVVDEVDGVVTGHSGSGGEGGFIKALIDLINLDQKNTTASVLRQQTSKTKRKRDDFRLLRPLILICNDVYHTSLRPLRTSGLAEIIHVRKAAVDKVIARLRHIFDREQIPCDTDAIRRLIELTWGISRKKESSSYTESGGDIRSLLVAAESAATCLREAEPSKRRLTRRWVEEHLGAAGHGANEGQESSRGGAREAVDRVFLENAGFAADAMTNHTTGPAHSAFFDPRSTTSKSAQIPSIVSTADAARHVSTQRLRQVIESCGESDRVVTDCFSTYPIRSFQDDTLLSKPNAACDWLHFHDQISSKIHHHQEWELGAYLSQAALGFHHLFASSKGNLFGGNEKATSNTNEGSGDARALMADSRFGAASFTGLRADYNASEALKESNAILQSFQSGLSSSLSRSSGTTQIIATEIIPVLIRILQPTVRPSILGGSGDQSSTVTIRKGSERKLVERAAAIMHEVGIRFDRTRLESDGLVGGNNFVYRMEPPLDVLCTFVTASKQCSSSGTTDGKTLTSSSSGLKTMGTSNSTTRYAVRQALDQEYRRYAARKEAEARQARFLSGVDPSNGNSIPEPFPEAMSRTSTMRHGQSMRGEVTKAESSSTLVKRDFFGRPLPSLCNSLSSLPHELGREASIGSASAPGLVRSMTRTSTSGAYCNDDVPDTGNVWVKFHEGFSNAVRKPITLSEIMRSL